MEQIYTIPVNEAFDAAIEDPSLGCPICALYRRLDDNELDRILGAAKMEPEIRQASNREGFCTTHFIRMTERRSSLALALMMESHLDEVKSMLADGPIGTPGDKPAKRIAALENSCYLCHRIEDSLSRMIETVVFLWRTDENFRRKYANTPRFCMPHLRRLINAGREEMNKKTYPEFYRVTAEIAQRYLDKLREDVSWFCKKFDYRYTDEPWYDAKDSLERTIGFLTANDYHTKEDKKK